MALKSAFALVFLGVVAGCTGEIGDLASDFGAEDDSGLTATLSVSDGWRSVEASEPAFESLEFELLARPGAARMDAGIALGGDQVSGSDDAPIKVRFGNEGFFEAEDGGVWDSDAAISYQPRSWYRISIFADLVNGTYDVDVSEEYSEKKGRLNLVPRRLISGATFDLESRFGEWLKTWAAWSSHRVKLEITEVSWVASGKCGPSTCDSLGVECGAPSDGCGGTLDCGGCLGAGACDAGVCVCSPRSCDSIGAECGTVDDGCGGVLSCGVCGSGETCDAGVCVSETVPPSCEPQTCQSSGTECGVVSDGCGGTLSCGGCPGGEFCNGGQCECAPRSCLSLGVECGAASNGCGGSLSCGSCPSGETCQGGTCVSVSSPPCVRATCASLGAECGVVGDGCGGTLNCGGCGSGQTCNGDVCECAPDSCLSLGVECGTVSNGCGGNLSCGGCAAGETCNSSGSCETVSSPPPTPGSWPSPTEALGHRHPECLARYGRTPAQIEATPCNTSGGRLAAGTTYSACSMRSAIHFAGSNTTLDCVYIDTGDGSPAGTFCDDPSGNCSNLTMRRTTFKGSLGPGSTGYTQLMISLTSSRGFKSASMLIDDSDIMESQVLVMCGSAINGSNNPYPGEGDKALVIRGSRFGKTIEYNDAHTDYVFLAEGCKGVLIEQSLFDGQSAFTNVGSIVQAQGATSEFGNHVFRNNRFIHDGSGHMFNFDRGSNTSSSACADPVVFDSNLFDWRYDLSDGKADVLFNYSTTGRECTRIESRPGSYCRGNVLASGSGVGCSSNGT